MDKTAAFEKVIQLASQATLANEVPIGALIVQNDEILASAHNETEKRNSFLAHAEMIAIERATEKLGSKYLVDCELYVSLEPCAMCLHAAKLSRIKTIYYLLKSEKFGTTGIAYYKTTAQNFSEESLCVKQQELMTYFFKNKRP